MHLFCRTAYSTFYTADPVRRRSMCHSTSLVLVLGFKNRENGRSNLGQQKKESEGYKKRLNETKEEMRYVCLVFFRKVQEERFGRMERKWSR